MPGATSSYPPELEREAVRLALYAVFLGAPIERYYYERIHEVAITLSFQFNYGKHANSDRSFSQERDKP